MELFRLSAVLSFVVFLTVLQGIANAQTEAQTEPYIPTACGTPAVDDDGDGLIEICYVEDLNAIRYQLDGSGYRESTMADVLVGGCPESGCRGYELIRDLDFEDDLSYRTASNKTIYTGDGGWEPIGDLPSEVDESSCVEEEDEPCFSAIFNGNGYVISNLSVSKGADTIQGEGDAGQTGLFGAITEAQVLNIGLVDVEVLGINGAAGGLVGVAETTSVIANSYATGHVIGKGEDSGGLVGLLRFGASIRDSYAAVRTEGTGNMGGLVARVDNARIYDSYAIGEVAASPDAPDQRRLGGLIAKQDNDVVIRNSYWNSDIFGGSSIDGAQSFTTEEMTSPVVPSTATAEVYYNWNPRSWDFGTASQYPVLKYNDESCDTEMPSLSCGAPTQEGDQRVEVLLRGQRSQFLMLGTVNGVLVPSYPNAVSTMTGITQYEAMVPEDVRSIVFTPEVAGIMDGQTAITIVKTVKKVGGKLMEETKGLDIHNNASYEFVMDSQATEKQIVFTLGSQADVEYTLVVFRDLSANGELNRVAISPADDTSRELPPDTVGGNRYTVDKDIAQVRITALEAADDRVRQIIVTADDATVLTVDGSQLADNTSSDPISLTPGQTETITLAVIAESGTTTTHIIEVYKQRNNADLQSLTVSDPDAPIALTYSAASLSYSARVPFVTTQVRITALQAADERAMRIVATVGGETILIVDGNQLAANTSSDPVSLISGEAAIITITVSAEDGSTKEYSVSVRRLFNNADLASIAIAPADDSTNPIDPDTEGGFSYTVDSRIAQVRITALEAASEQAMRIVASVGGDTILTVEGNQFASSTSSAPISLTPDQTTTITVTVTAEDGTMKSHNITVRRNVFSNNADLASIAIAPANDTANPIAPDTVGGLIYTVDSRMAQMRITALEAADERAMRIVATVGGTTILTVEGNRLADGTFSDPISLPPRQTTIITITVTAEDGTQVQHPVSIISQQVGIRLRTKLFLECAISVGSDRSLDCPLE